MAKLYVGNLPYTTTNQDLQDMFSSYGTVTSANIVMDRYSGKSKGFGFVELDSDESAQKAISELNGSQAGGRNIIVSIARPREERPQGGNRFQGRDNRNFNRRDDRPRR